MMADDLTPDTPDLRRDAALRALAENPTVRPSLRVAARKALRHERQAREVAAASAAGAERAIGNKRRRLATCHPAAAPGPSAPSVPGEPNESGAATTHRD